MHCVILVDFGIELPYIF